MASTGYSIDFSAADPTHYPRLSASQYLALHGSFPVGGRLDGSQRMPGATAELESLTPQKWNPDVGQIVVWQLAVDVDAKSGIANGSISITLDWGAETTSKEAYGFDTSAGRGMVAAFVDTSDPGLLDAAKNARVTGANWAPVVRSSNRTDWLEGQVTLGGLDAGDHVTLEVWTVLRPDAPDKLTGNIQSELVSARTAGGASINVGNQTIPLKIAEPPTFQISGTTFEDRNGDGLLGTGEAGLAGATVRLLDAAGNPVLKDGAATATLTDANGAYGFAGLQPGTYRLQFVVPAGYEITRRDTGADSDADPAAGLTGSIALAAGQSETRVDAGFRKVAAPADDAPGGLPVTLGPGNDSWSGTDGAEGVDGGAGNDALIGNGGDDILSGGAGSDSLYGHDGDDTLWGGAGADLLHGLAGDDLIKGGSGDDTSEGGDGRDTVDGAAGDDAMQGEGGDDVLFGGAGRDTVEGNAGADLLLGRTGSDWLAGHDANDTLIGGADDGRARLHGGAIAELVVGDRIHGDGGVDLFIYRRGDGVDELADLKPAEGDRLVILGHAGFAAVLRQDSRTILWLGEDAAIVLTDWYPAQDLSGPFPGITFEPGTAGASDEAVMAAHADGTTGTGGSGGTGGGTGSGGPGAGTWRDGVLRGTEADDILVASGWNNRIEAGAGNDTIDAGEGNATIDAGGGNNTIRVGGWSSLIRAGDGDNRLSGPLGNTTVQFGNGSAQVSLGGYGNSITLGVGDSAVHAGEGNATIRIAGGSNTVAAPGYGNHATTGSGDDTISGISGNAEIDAGDGDNRISAQGFSNRITTGAGKDTIVSGEGTAAVRSGAGADDITVSGWGNRVEAGDGDDRIWLVPGDGDGLLDGGPGTDTLALAGAVADYRVGRSGDQFYLAGPGNASCELRAIERLSFQGGEEREVAALLAGGAVEEMAIVATGAGAAPKLLDIYSGPVGYLRYQLLGSDQGEVVHATGSNDFLNLLQGDDAADGAEGDDVIDGGKGSNFLTGGAGRDVFFLDGRGGGTTWATITDWQEGEELSIWGWRPGVSRVAWADGAGAPGYEGVTMHADLDGDGMIDTSVTWTGLGRGQLSSAREYDGLLWFA